MDKENQIDNIKEFCRNELQKYSSMKKPEGIDFYAMTKKENRYLILTGEEMDKYFSKKYPRWMYCFDSYDFRDSNYDGLSICDSDDVSKFLIKKYKQKKIEERLGKIF